MPQPIETIPLLHLSLAFIPAILTVGILFKWSLNAGNALYAIVRMLVQLLLIGYILNFIFDTEKAGVILAILLVMVIASSWIALGTVPGRRVELFKQAFIAIVVGGGFTLVLITQGVLQLDPWYQPQTMIPIAGMIFANTMNSVSLAVERLQAEISRGVAYEEAKSIAFQSSMIPVINSLFAVGLVSLPGMMTGQILSGVSPLVAARYQIMVMCMIFGSSGIATAYFLMMVKMAFSSKDQA